MTRTTTLTNMYVYADPNWSKVDLSGCAVEALDGEIGKVDEVSYHVGTDALIVDTGGWIFGKKVMLPAGLISRIDQNDHRVWVDLTKDQIKNAPEFDEAKLSDPRFRDDLGTYYGTHVANRPAGPDFGKDDRSR